MATQTRARSKRPATHHPEAVVTSLRIPVSQNSEDIITEVIDLTPQWAAELLAKNTMNRALNKASVQRITNEITGGRWKFNGEPIIVSSTDKLLDGQHRCQAVIKANKTVKTLLVYGVPDVRFDSIDKGTARGNHDVLSAKGVEYARPLAAAAALVDSIENGRMEFKFRNQFGILEFVKAHPKLLDSVTHIFKHLHQTKRLIPMSAASAMHYMFAQISPDEADNFWHRVMTGEDIRAGMPEYWLRQWLLQRRDMTVDQHKVDMRSRGAVRQICCYCVIAWNKRRDQQEMRSTPRWSLSADGFPKIK